MAGPAAQDEATALRQSQSPSVRQDGRTDEWAGLSRGGARSRARLRALGAADSSRRLDLDFRAVGWAGDRQPTPSGPLYAHSVTGFAAMNSSQSLRGPRSRSVASRT